MIRDVAAPVSVVVPGGLPVIPCMVCGAGPGDSNEAQSHCSPIAPRGYARFGMRLFDFREALVYVIPGRVEDANPESRDSGSGACAPSRNDGSIGMTFLFVGHYSNSGAVAASSHSFVASSTCGRTSWRTLAW